MTPKKKAVLLLILSNGKVAYLMGIPGNRIGSREIVLGRQKCQPKKVSSQQHQASTVVSQARLPGDTKNGSTEPLHSLPIQKVKRRGPLPTSTSVCSKNHNLFFWTRKLGLFPFQKGNITMVFITDTSSDFKKRWMRRPKGSQETPRHSFLDGFLRDV